MLDVVQLLHLVQQNLSSERETVPDQTSGENRIVDFVHMPEITSTLRRGMPICSNPPAPTSEFSQCTVRKSNLI
jgi:hypothetical protein